MFAILVQLLNTDDEACARKINYEYEELTSVPICIWKSFQKKSPLFEPKNTKGSVSIRIQRDESAISFTEQSNARSKFFITSLGKVRKITPMGNYQVAVNERLPSEQPANCVQTVWKAPSIFAGQ